MQNCIEHIAFPRMVPEKVLKASDRGCVCLVRSRDDARRYIYRSFLGTAEVYRRMRSIDCPHLPKIYDVLEENGRVCVLEEYVQGDTLAFLLEGAPFSPAQARQILLQLCAALEVLHGIGAVHRDIKPDNIILRGSVAVLIDFDASRLCKVNSHMDTQVMGTTGYAAPEQYGFNQTDARTDIYALGILLNEMLTLRHPSRQLAQGACRPIIQKCTQINAGQRYSSVTELAAALAPARRRMVKGPLLLLSAVLLLGGGLLYSARAGEAEAPETAAPTTLAQIRLPNKPPYYELPEIDVFVREKLEFSTQAWELSTDGYGTPFKCDMDGDGEAESYLFGVDFINSPHENVVYFDRNTAYPGDYHIRSIHPCVWLVKPDGTMEVAEAFAQFLTDARVILWRVDDFESPEPEAWTADYLWPGCVKIIFRPEQDGTWLYEISAYLGEHKLTAMATTTFYFE